MSQRQRPQKLHEAQEKYKEVTPQYTCMVCSKKIEGYYGQHQDGGTCSRACERAQMALPRYPGHDEASFLERFGL